MYTLAGLITFIIYIIIVIAAITAFYGVVLGISEAQGRREGVG